jgi:predicted deacetylase
LSGPTWQNKQYLVRLDDACPTANWAMWAEAEAILNQFGIKPIVAVIPDNRDPKLVYGPPIHDFWSRVKRWEDRGWTIAMHGYQHLFSTTSSGIVGLNHYSEFAGLNYLEQAKKVSAGYEIMAAHRIQPTAWVAPAHSFDENTLRALALQLDRRLLISDGLFRLPHRDAYGLFWIPQQIWRFRPMPPGVWTVCLHPSEWTCAYGLSFKEDIGRFHESVTDTREISRAYGSRKPSASDRVFAKIWRQAVHLRTGCNQRRMADLRNGQPQSATIQNG